MSLLPIKPKRGSQRQLSKRFQVSLSFVRDLLRRYRKTGSIESKPHGGGATAKLSEAQLPIVGLLVETQPDALLIELGERFADKTGVRSECFDDAASRSTLEVKRQKTLVPAEQQTQRVQDLRFAHQDWTFTVDPHHLVFVDETGMHLGLTRLYGRAPIGERLYDTDAPGYGGENISN